jgi:hypothetical protein
MIYGALVTQTVIVVAFNMLHKQFWDFMKQ